MIIWETKADLTSINVSMVHAIAVEPPHFPRVGVRRKLCNCSQHYTLCLSPPEPELIVSTPSLLQATAKRSPAWTSITPARGCCRAAGTTACASLTSTA